MRLNGIFSKLNEFQWIDKKSLLDVFLQCCENDHFTDTALCSRKNESIKRNHYIILYLPSHSRDKWPDPQSNILVMVQDTELMVFWFLEATFWRKSGQCADEFFNDVYYLQFS